MSNKHIVHAAVVLVVLSLLAACGPAASPVPPASPVPTETAVPTPNSAPTEVPTDTPVPTPNNPGGPTFREGFEEGLEGWQRRSDVPEDPDRPGEPIAWSIEVSPEQTAEGVSSARFTIDGKQDDGTIWLARSFAVEPDATVRVTLAFDLWSASESFNTLARVAAYAGPRPPGDESDFDVSQAANLVEGWRTYEYTFDVSAGADGRVWVALGISAVWETKMTYFVDHVRVDVAPAEAGQPSQGGITVTGVQVSAGQVVVRGTSTLPQGSCVSSELWADGAPVSWWPTEAGSPVMDGAWEITVPLEPGQALEPGVQYMVRAYQPGGPNSVSTFPFDLDAPPAPPSGEDPTLLLPESAEPLHRASADLNADGTPEEMVVTGWGGSPDRLGYDFLQLFVLASEEGGYVVAWQSDQLPTERAEPLEVRDVNGDGRPEVLSVQAVGASGETLYVLAWQGDAYGWLTPQGGHFDGRPSFGEDGVRVEDVDHDGLPEILASYGPAARSTDVYGWDGQAYAYRETLGGSDASYQRVPVAEAGLSLDVPAGWTQVDPGTWAAPQDPGLRLGVRWVELKPPQEPEAALLPNHARTLDAHPVELAWGSGRRFTVQVYGEAEEGGGQAPVASVENHVLVVIERDGGRWAIDVYASAPTGDQLAGLDAALERATTSLELE